YALAAGPGDWRAAGFVAEAEDYNHELVAVVGDPGETGVPGGPGAMKPGFQGVAGGLSVEPRGVTVSAVKPRGNPLASGRRPGAGDTVTVRLRETEGRPVTARVRLAGDVSAAWLTDLLEESDGAPLPVEDGAIAVDMSPFSTVTVAVRAGGAHGPAATEVAAQPAYARYWLHGTGPAPAGNLPVAVHLSPVRVALPEPGEPAALRLTVGCGAEPASGTAELIVPDGVTVSPAGPFRYVIAAGGYAAWDLTVRAAGPPGRYFV